MFAFFQFFFFWVNHSQLYFTVSADYEMTIASERLNAKCGSYCEETTEWEVMGDGFETGESDGG